MRKLILRNTQSPGDLLQLTIAIRDLHHTFAGQYLTDVRTSCPEIFENNPHITHIDDKDPEAELVAMNYDLIHESGWNGEHFSAGFIKCLSDHLGIPPYKRHSLLPDLHISAQEKGWTNQVAVEFQYPGKFWLIQAGYKSDNPLKDWPHYQEVVDGLRDRVQFVQIGSKGDANNPHIHHDLKGVYSLVGKTDLRQLIRLAYWAEGSVGPISLHMVLMAAFQKPCVVIAGGKEPVRWQLIPNHQYLYMNGAMKCCAYNGCWKSAYKDCTDRVGTVPRCYALIRAEDVIRAVDKYYLGGMLSHG